MANPSECMAPQRLGIPYRGILQFTTVPALLQAAFPGVEIVIGRQRCLSDPALDSTLGWGRKPSTFFWTQRLSSSLAENIATARKLVLWRCEDSFVRSLTPGPTQPPLGLVLDNCGIYYDASSPSRLEALISSPLGAQERDRARGLIQLWRKSRVSKYNYKPESQPPGEPYVLVVDQTAHDCSIALGSADSARFSVMLEEALLRHPHCMILIKTHPVVASGKKRGHFSQFRLQDQRIRLDVTGGHPTALIEHAEAVYVVTSQTGFEALIWGKPVYCFGMPFYAGWGLTNDYLLPPHRRAGKLVTLESLVHAALVDYAVYLDPFVQHPVSPEQVIEAIGQHRSACQHDPPMVAAIGFNRLQRRQLQQLLPGSKFIHQPWWKRKICNETPLLAATTNLSRSSCLEAPRYRLHKGVLHGLPYMPDSLSTWILERSGDTPNPQDLMSLESVLQVTALSKDQCQRARLLRRRIVNQFFLSNRPIANPPLSSINNLTRIGGDQSLVLAIDDEEIGSSSHQQSNSDNKSLQLIRNIHRKDPSAAIVFCLPDGRSICPPPDITTQCRSIVTPSSLPQILRHVKSVHVHSSPHGFFALLLGLKVFTYGWPFYAGWGLTEDSQRFPGRQRNLSLDELVYGTLITHPRYLSKKNGWLISVERAIDEITPKAHPSQRSSFQSLL